MSFIVSGFASAARWLLPAHPCPGPGYEHGVTNENYQLAKLCVRWSELAYKISSDAEGKEKGFKFLSEPKHDTQVIIGKDDERKAVVVAFRGTSGLHDTLVDVEVIKTNNSDLGGRIHVGFLNAYLEVVPAVDKEVAALFSENKDFKNLIVTGHSLGGALCTLYGKHATEKYPDAKFQFVSFGSPRCGNEAFAHACDSAFNGCYHRWVHQNDIVPREPKINYHHTGMVEYLAGDGSIYSAKRPDAVEGYLYSTAEWLEGLKSKGVFARLDDHHVKEYQTAIDDYTGAFL